MIKQEIEATINGYSFNGEVIVPSAVMTSTPQEEDFNLTYSPNFQMKLDDSYSYLTVTDRVEVTFSYDGIEYTAYADVLNRAGKTVTLQYADGLIANAISSLIVNLGEYTKSTISNNYATIPFIDANLVDNDDPEFNHAVTLSDLNISSSNEYVALTKQGDNIKWVNESNKTNNEVFSPADGVYNVSVQCSYTQNGETFTTTYGNYSESINWTMMLSYDQSVATVDNKFFVKPSFYSVGTGNMYNYKYDPLDCNNEFAYASDTTFDLTLTDPQNNIMFTAEPYSEETGIGFNIAMTPADGVTLQPGESISAYCYFNCALVDDGSSVVNYDMYYGMFGNKQFSQYVYEAVSGSRPMFTYTQPTVQSIYFTSPVDGDTITGTLDSDLGEFKYPIEVVDGDGNNISYDITAVSVTCDNQDVAVGYEEDVDENEQTYISGVYLYIYNTGTGTATLTFTDPESGDTCTTTFTYDITAASPDEPGEPVEVSMKWANMPAIIFQDDSGYGTTDPITYDEGTGACSILFEDGNSNNISKQMIDDSLINIVYDMTSEGITDGTVDFYFDNFDGENDTTNGAVTVVVGDIESFTEPGQTLTLKVVLNDANYSWASVTASSFNVEWPAAE